MSRGKKYRPEEIIPKLRGADGLRLSFNSNVYRLSCLMMERGGHHSSRARIDAGTSFDI